MKKILGIDPGFARVGFAILREEDNNHFIEKTGCIETLSKTPYEERLAKIGKEIKKIIKKHKPNMVAIERLFFTTNQKTALNVAEARGVLIYIVNEANIPIVEFTPLQVKVAVCGYGKADKKQITDMVQILLKMEKTPKHDDTTDAIAIALTAFAHSKWSELAG